MVHLVPILLNIMFYEPMVRFQLELQLNRDSPTLRDRGGVGLPKMSDYQRLALHMYLI